MFNNLCDNHTNACIKGRDYTLADSIDIWYFQRNRVTKSNSIPKNVNMNSTKIFLLYILFLQLVSFAISKRQIKRSTNNAIIDFRYNSCRIDAITRLPNNTLFVVSNGYYWVLNERQTPRPYNVAGRVSRLYPKFNTIDAIFTDPINEVDPKIFLVSHVSSFTLSFCDLFLTNRYLSPKPQFIVA